MSIKHQIRALTRKRIEEFLENEACFRDYRILPSAYWRRITRAGTINLLSPDQRELEDALEVFCRDGYSEVLIYI